MCIILDTNTSAEFFPPSIDAKPVISRIRKGSLRVVSGHKLKQELLGCSFRKIYRQLLLAGQLTEFPDDSVSKEIAVVRDKGPKSNDHHILALARISGARILFSRDIALHADFKNRSILGDRKGKVYQSCEHARILDEVECECD
jgi:hypothetical protein